MSGLEDRIAWLEAEVRRLVDEREILRVLQTYGYALDYGLIDEWADLWTEDAVLHWPGKLTAAGVDDRAPILGHAAIVEACRMHTHAPDKFHKHMVVDARIAIDGDTATAESMFQRLDSYAVGPQIRSFGRYLDTLARGADGRWRIRERRLEREGKRPLEPGER